MLTWKLLSLCNAGHMQCYKTNSQINVNRKTLDDFDELY